MIDSVFQEKNESFSSYLVVDYKRHWILDYYQVYSNHFVQLFMGNVPIEMNELSSDLLFKISAILTL